MWGIICQQQLNKKNLSKRGKKESTNNIKDISKEKKYSFR